MEILMRGIQSSRFSVVSGMLLAVLYGTFAHVHLDKFMETGQWSLLLIVFFESLATLFFLIRSDPETVSTNPYDWGIAVIGTLSPLLLRPSDYGVLPEAEMIIVAGVLLQIAGLISLNRSCALVAAKREIKTNWMYRVVRHPLYAAYFLAFGGYVLVYTTPANILIYAVMITFLCLRMFREENHLSQDSKYREYMAHVRYRVIPYVF